LAQRILAESEIERFERCIEAQRASARTDEQTNLLIQFFELQEHIEVVACLLGALKPLDRGEHGLRCSGLFRNCACQSAHGALERSARCCLVIIQRAEFGELRIVGIGRVGGDSFVVFD
jgi:hypothetical protein